MNQGNSCKVSNNEETEPYVQYMYNAQRALLYMYMYMSDN